MSDRDACALQLHRDRNASSGPMAPAAAASHRHPGRARSPQEQVFAKIAVAVLLAKSKDIHISLASNVIAALRTLETGQFFSASLAIRPKAASSRFGTWASKVRADRLIRNP